MNKVRSKLFTLFLLSFTALFFLSGFAHAQGPGGGGPGGGGGSPSRAACSNINVTVNGNSVTLSGTVTETSPGIDGATTYGYIYVQEASYINGDAWGTYSATPSASGGGLSGNTYRAVLDGTAWSHPGGSSSTCSSSRFFTIDIPRWTLFVEKNGSGYVSSSNVGGIDCGGGCSAEYDEGTWVTLEANPSSGYNFTGWDGECSGTGSCTFQMNGNRYVTANFEAAQTAPGNFNITGSACYGWPSPAIEVNFGSSSGATSYSLQKWNGSSYQTIFTGSYQEVDNYGDTNISMGSTYWYRVVAHNGGNSTNSNNDVSHTPTASDCGQVLYTVTASIGTPSGSISGDVTCPGSCQATVEANDSVTLIASPSTNYAFSSWTGACAGQTSTCNLVVTGNMNTSAHFGPNNYQLQVTKLGNGSGTITSSPAGINCPGDCSENYNYSTQVTLTRSTDPGTDFGGWGGVCNGNGMNCNVTMNAAKTVTATFTANLYSMTVNPNGLGTITGSGGISCPGNCGANFTYNTPITLTASGSGGSSFSSWSGACAGQGATCNLTMDASKSTTANFVANFNYSLSNSGTSNVTKTSGDAYTQNTITKTLTAGTTQSVSLVVSGTPPGASYNISNLSCAPTCSSTITFTVGPTTPVGTHPITVTGSLLGKTTNFNLVVTGAPFSVSCDGAPDTVYLNETVTWTTTVSGGVPPFTYTWYGSGYPTGGNENVSGNRTEQSARTYTTIGIKSVYTTVRDADSVTVVCPAATVQVNFDPNFKEF